MLMKLNGEYEFMEASGPKMSEYLKVKYAAAGGETAKKKKPKDDEDEDEDEDEPQGVLQSGFNQWYPDFYVACEEKKRDEFLATKDLKEEELAEYWAERPLRVRNQLYPALAGPQVGLKDWQAHAASASKERQQGRDAAEQEALMAQRDKEDGGEKRRRAELGAL